MYPEKKNIKENRNKEENRGTKEEKWKVWHKGGTREARNKSVFTLAGASPVIRSGSR